MYRVVDGLERARVSVTTPRLIRLDRSSLFEHVIHWLTSNVPGIQQSKNVTGVGWESNEKSRSVTLAASARRVRARIYWQNVFLD